MIEKKKKEKKIIQLNTFYKKVNQTKNTLVFIYYENSRTDGDIESTYISSQVCDLNDFILQDYIGSGSFGKVYKVKEKKTGRILAAKISIQALYEDSTEEIQNLSREVNIISKLNQCENI